MRRKIFLPIAMIALTLLAGCQKTDDNQLQQPISEKIPESQLTVESPEEELSDKEQSEEQPLKTQEPVSAPQQSQPENTTADFRFEMLSDRVFDFSSGVGAWGTEVFISSDGTFKGNYHDANMGDAEDAYPNGTIYLCSFKGAFNQLEKVDEFTYKLKLSSLVYDDEPEKEEIADGVRYIYSTAYGLDEGTDFYLYLPGAKLSDLPEGFRNWVGYHNLENVTETELPFYGLYNVTTQDGFSSHVYEEQSLSERIAMEISFAEERDTELEAELQEAATQADIDAISTERFQLWDQTLNIVWKLLESELDDSSMETLRAEERDWIASKDAEIKAAGQEYEGGSMQATAESMKAAELTKKRVYELEKWSSKTTS